MRAATVFLCTLIAFSNGAYCQEADGTKVTGRFDFQGHRLESYQADPSWAKETAQNRSLTEKSCKSIAGWVEQFKTARSQRYQEIAARALLAIARRTDKDPQQLTQQETTDLRNACQKLCESDDEISPNVVSAFALVADASSVETLQKVLSKNTNKNITQSAIRGLKRIGNDSAVKSLKELTQLVQNELRKGEFTSTAQRDFTAIEQAIGALAEIGSPAARASLEELYQQKSGRTKEAAAEALDELDAQK